MRVRPCAADDIMGKLKEHFGGDAVFTDRAEFIKVGSGRYCSPHHRMPPTSRNESP